MPFIGNLPPSLLHFRWWWQLGWLFGWILR